MPLESTKIGLNGVIHLIPASKPFNPYSPLVRIPAVAMVLLGAFSGAACSPTTPSSKASPDGGGASATGTGMTAASALTCGGILECASKCGDNDAPCEDACIASGTPDAKTAAEAIVACITQFKCQDVTCFQESCSSELATCVKPAAGQPLSGSAPAGSVPAELVGQWYSHGELWDFKGDGSVVHGGSVNTSGCATGSTESGAAVASGTTLTIYFTSGGVSICGGSSSEPYAPNRKEFAYRLSSYHLDEGDRMKLTLTDTACVTTHNGDDLYCINGFDKQ